MNIAKFEGEPERELERKKTRNRVLKSKDSFETTLSLLVMSNF